MTRRLALTLALALVSLGVALVSLGVVASSARAQSTWVIAIGNNVGLFDEQPLRYAERDATEVAAVFQRLGGVSPERTVMVLGRDPVGLRQILESTSARIQAAGEDAKLIVFYSGHADARGIHQAGLVLPFPELEQMVRDASAKLKVLILDACRSGGVTRVKGVKAAETFAIKGDDDLAARGLAVITSSAAGEDSYESERLRASFFSHHLVTALRGAADADGDARIALDEAYRYTYEQTLKSSGVTNELQHPTFRFDVRGRGEVILTHVGEQANLARLVLPTPGTYLVIEGTPEGAVFAEATAARAGTVLTLPPGRFFVQERQATFYREYDVQVRAGQDASLASFEPTVIDYARLVRKGGGERAAVMGVRVHGGARGEILAGQGVTPQLVVGWGIDLAALSFGLRARWAPPMALGAASPDGLERTHGELGLALTLQRFFDASWASLGLGLLVEGAWIHQSFARGAGGDADLAGPAPARDAFAGSFGLLATLQVPLAGGLQLELEGGPLATVYERAVLSRGAAVERETASAVTWFATGGLAWTF